jgi:hypothetical protein
MNAIKPTLQRPFIQLSREGEVPGSPTSALSACSCSKSGWPHFCLLSSSLRITAPSKLITQPGLITDNHLPPLPACSFYLFELPATTTYD